MIIALLASLSFGLFVLSRIDNLLHAKVGDIWTVRILGSWISYEGSYLYARSRHWLLNIVVQLLSPDGFYSIRDV